MLCSHLPLFIEGIISFIVTGLDDFILLTLLYLRYKRNFTNVLRGFFLGLSIIILLSILSSFVFIDLSSVSFLSEYHLIIKLITYITVIYFFIINIKDVTTDINISKDYNNSVNKVVIKTVTIAYIIQGIDDYTIYTLFFYNIGLGGECKTAYILGIYTGLLLITIGVVLLKDKMIDLFYFIRNIVFYKNEKRVKELKIMDEYNITINKDYLKLLSQSKFIENINDLNIIFANMAKVLDLHRLILYKKINSIDVEVTVIYSTLENDLHSGDKIAAKTNINLHKAILYNRVSKEPVPDIGEDLVYPLDKEYFLGIDDINDARSIKDIELFLIESMVLSIKTSMKIFSLIHSNTYDALTKILNRGALDKYIDFNKTPFNKDYHYVTGLIFLDIDHFGNFNKDYGHSIGDIVLRDVSKMLNKLSNENSASVYRYGGEEFVILCTEDNLFEFSEKLRNSIENMISSAQIKIPTITISLGIEEYKNVNDRVQMIKNANTALLYAKNNGRNKSVLFAEIK